MTTHSVAIVQSILLGAGRPGNSFNDLENVIGSNDVTIDTKASIKSIELICSQAIDGIKITYRKTSDFSDYTPQYHGTSDSCKDKNVSTPKIELLDTEHIIAISGKAGKTTAWGTRVCALCFAIYDSATGETRVTDLYGGTDGTAFRVTANGYFVGFGGYAIDTSLSLKELKDKNIDGGLYGLTMFDIAYSKV
ncbi:hypothetical protein B0H16DRAFT_455087 [Mycena metata]|uniref:Jacalin-type lectin domain-containing protein n=1 Tax=Mycena metata TaxID=1033252 RepID=A0AAD7NK50_9AGAR|nr:hypothetical protein B0H16DRAFT_455087 [Mycena metata]